MKLIRSPAVLITGASRGIGEALALEFARNGYFVIINGRDEERLIEVSKKISDFGIPAHIIIGDLRDKTVLNCITDAMRFWNVGSLINNAAEHLSGRGIPLESIDDFEIDAVIGTNLTALIKLTSRIYNFFVEQRNGGTIVNMNSIVGLEPKENKSIFCAAKWGLRGFTDSLKLEAMSTKKNIRVFGVYMSQVKTKPEHTYGWEISEVVSRIYGACVGSSYKDLILDGRPEEFRPKKEAGS